MTLLAALLVLAAVWDLWKKKIPNRLILIGFVLGLVRFLFGQESESFLGYLPGIIIPTLICFPLFLTGTLGAGDIKLFSLIGCFLPISEAFNCIILSFFLAGVASLLILLKNKTLFHRMEYAGKYLLDCLHSGTLKSYYPEGDEGEKMKKDNSISFAVPILISTLFILGGKHL